MRQSVLLIEDNEDTLATLETLLDSANFDCRSVTTRDDAKELLDSGYRPGCVLMDYMMPGMSLTQFMKTAKDLNLKIILTTAHSDIQRIANRFGFKYLLSKPVMPDDLINAVKRCLESGEHTAV